LAGGFTTLRAYSTIRDIRVGVAFDVLNVVSGPASGVFSRDASAECCETPSCKVIVFVEPLNDLEIIGAGEIDGARVRFAKERDQPQAARRSDIIRNLQQAMNCFGFERWMFPELQQMRARTRPSPSSTNCLNTEVGTL
jgi:hypothetical protein